MPTGGKSADYLDKETSEGKLGSAALVRGEVKCMTSASRLSCKANDTAQATSKGVCKDSPPLCFSWETNLLLCLWPLMEWVD